MLTLPRQPYGKSTARRSLRLTPETLAALARLARPGLQAAAIALAVQLLDVAVSACAVEADELGEVLVAACGWETARLCDGLRGVICAVERVQGEYYDWAMEETL